MDSTNTNSRLGKGLAALISQDKIDNKHNSYIPNLSIDWISPNPHQPRMAIKPEDLLELSKSIEEYGVLEPLLVVKEGDKNYILIAGERRLRAAQLAAQKTVPVVIMDEASPLQMLQIAIIENIQRKDLNALEEAMAYEKLAQEHSLSHADIAKTLGLERVTVTNKIRLLKLPDEVKEQIISGTISEGHGRALLGLENDQSIITAAKTIANKNLSVRATEELVRKVSRVSSSANGTKTKSKAKGGRPGVDFYKTEADYKWEKELAAKLKTDVKIERYANNSGKLMLKYDNQAQLDTLLKKISS
jgi:ParB family transcriptional regulator, chromosome partitioning protein